MINTWNESLLHEELKQYFRGDNSNIEVPIDGSICDAVNEDGSIIEIQTAHLSKLKTKLEKLLKNHAITLVYPVALNTLIETYDTKNVLQSSRKSPKHGSIYQIFKELTGMYSLLANEKLTLVVVLSDIMEIRVADGKGSWRRKGISRKDKKLIKIHEIREFNTLKDYAELLPKNLPEIFTVAELKKEGPGIYASYMAWVLRKTGILLQEGKRGNAFLYRCASLHLKR